MVTPCKGVIRFGERGKINPRYNTPLEILAMIGSVTYKLKSPQEISKVYDTFHVCNLKKCLADDNFIIPLDKIQVKTKLHFMEELVEIMDREIKRLKQSHKSIVKVRWHSHRGLEFRWEREDQVKQKYPHFFSDAPPLVK